MEQKENIGCLPVFMMILMIGLLAVILWTNRNKISGGVSNGEITTSTVDSAENTYKEDKEPEATVAPPEKGKQKFVRTTTEMNLRKSDGSRTVIAIIPKGEVVEVKKKDPHNPNRLIVLWNDMEGSLWNHGLKEVENKVPETTAPQETKPNNEEKEPETMVDPPEKGKQKFVRTTTEMNLRKSDGSRTVIAIIPKGEVVEVKKKDPHNPNRLIVLWNDMEGSLWNHGLKEVENKVPETTAPQETKPNKEDKEPEATQPQETKPNKEDEVPETTTPVEPPETSNPTTSCKFAVTTGELNLREPDGSGKLIQLLQPGEVLEILEQDPKNSKRVIVLWHGIKGSVLNSSQKELKNIPEFYGKGYNGVCYSTNLNFRVAGEDSELIETINKNHYFQVLGTYAGDDTRVVAIFRGRVGTLLRKSITKIKGNAVYIDEKMQMATLIKNGEFVANTPCVTGTKGKSETPKGRWKIYSKQEDRYLQGKDLEGKPYKSWVEYWMPFKGGCGLHDASWRSQFGGSIYKTNGSLGCVNLPSWFAEKVYDSVKINDEVCVAN